MLLRLYVEDLWKQSDGVERLTLDHLTLIKPGFGAYFQDWLTRQRKTWAGEGVKVGEDVVDAHLAVLACAYGRLTADGLAELVQRAHGIARSPRLENVLYPIRRFIVGVGRDTNEADAGYVLSHPKLGQYLCEEYFDRTTIVHTRQTIAEWGCETVKQATKDLSRPNSIPPYILQYLVQHLDDVSAVPSTYMSLVEEGWLRAWEAFEGGYRGFAHSVEEIFNRVCSAGPEFRLRYAWMIRCRLIGNSLVSIGSSIPARLLVACVSNKVINHSQCIYWLKYAPAVERLRGFAALTALTDGARRQLIFDEALEAVRAINYWSDLTSTTIEVLSNLSEEERTRLLTHVLDKIKFNDDAAWAIRELAPVLPKDLLTVAREIAGNIKPADRRCRAFTGLAGYLGEPGRSLAVSHALNMINQIESDWERATILRELSPYITPGLIETAVGVMRGLEDIRVRIKAITHLAPYLPSSERAALICGAGYLAGRIEQPASKAIAFASLAQHLAGGGTQSLLSEAVRTARAIDDSEARAGVLAELIPYIPKQQREEFVVLSIKDAREIEEWWKRDLVMKDFAPYLSKALQLDVEVQYLAAGHFVSVMAGAGGTSDVSQQARISAERAMLVAEPKRSEALSEALKKVGYADIPERSKGLAALAPYLPKVLLREALTCAKTIGDTIERMRVLACLAEQMSKPAQSQIESSILSELQAISNEWMRSRGLVAIAPHLSDHGLAEVLHHVEQIENSFTRFTAIESITPNLPTSLLPHSDRIALSLPPSDQARLKESFKYDKAEPQLSQKAFSLGRVWRSLSAVSRLNAAKSIEAFSPKIHAIAEVLPDLSEVERTNAAQCAEEFAREIENAGARIENLIAIAKKLSGDGRERILRDCLDDARAIADPGSRAKALTDVISLLEQSVSRESCVEIISAIEQSYGTYVSDSGQIYASSTDEIPRIISWAITVMPENFIQQLFATVLQKSIKVGRASLFERLQPFLPASVIGGEVGLLEVSRAISDTARWFP